MKYLKYIIFIPLVLSVFFNGCQIKGYEMDKNNGEKYYISLSGNDQNPGTKSKPWQSIEKLNSVELLPGDEVHFMGGSTYHGTIVLNSADSGSNERRILITSYGGKKAVINGGTGAGLIAIGCNHLRISDLIFHGDGRKDGNVSDGVYITQATNVAIENCEVSGFQHSGVHMKKVTDAEIMHVYAHNNGFAGIHISGETAYNSSDYDNSNIYIGYCTAENNPGDPTVKANHSGNGILASSVNKGIIEYCRAFNNGWDMEWTGNGPVGIWIWDSTDFIIQYCISHDNKTNPIAKDGGGFDFDGGVSNSILQYCISYNNQGAGIGLFEFGAAKTWENNTVRYNISVNDGIINPGALAIWKNEPQGTMRNCEIYNNTFYNDTAHGVALWIDNNLQGFNFRNNIFVYRSSFLHPGHKIENEVFQGNCYWSLKGDESIAGYKNMKEWALSAGQEMIDGNMVGFYTDPMLQGPFVLNVTDPEEINVRNLSAFALRSGSPLIDRGLDLGKLYRINTGSNDIAGTPVPQGKAYDQGALEYRVN
jgi:hypothetical protein